MASDRGVLLDAHALLRRGVFEACDDELYGICQEAYELVDDRLRVEGVEMALHPVEVEALVAEDADRSLA